MAMRPALEQRAYEVHGIPVSVCAPDPAVLDAMDLRLRDFADDSVPPAPTARPAPGLAEGGVRLEFFSGVEGLPVPSGDGRPVYDTPHGTLFYHPAADALWGELAGVTLRCEPGRGVATIASACLEGQQLYLATHPLATIGLMELFERRGLFSLHAGCVARADRTGLLLAGPSGAGKSTLALALARSGLSFLSDDIVFLAEDEVGTTHVLGFRDAVGLTDRSVERFEDLRPALEDPPEPGFPKRLRRIEELMHAPRIGACVPSTLVFPEVAPEAPSAIRPLDGKQALLRLVPDVLLTEPLSTQAHLQAIGTLLERVRCYALTSGADLEHAAELARSTL